MLAPLSSPKRAIALVSEAGRAIGKFYLCASMKMVVPA